MEILTFSRFVNSKVSVRYDASCFACADRNDTDNGLSHVSPRIARSLFKALTCTASRKKFKLNSGKDRINLLATVIIIEEAQYESTGGIGLSFLLGCMGRGDCGLLGSNALLLSPICPISMPS